MSIAKTESIDEVVVSRDEGSNDDVFSCTLKARVRRPFAIASTVVFLALSVVSVVFMITSREHLAASSPMMPAANLVRAAGKVVEFQQQVASSASLSAADHRKLTKDKTITKKAGRVLKTHTVKGDVDTINFQESFNPTPTRWHPTSAPSEEVHHTTKTVNTINFEETFNPTPTRFNTGTPVQERREMKRELKMRTLKTDPILAGVFAPRTETYAPTPENKKRELKHSGGQTYNPTPEGFGKQTYAPTPENKKKRDLKTVNFVETFNPTPEDKKRGLKHTPEQ